MKEIRQKNSRKMLIAGSVLAVLLLVALILLLTRTGSAPAGEGGEAATAEPAETATPETAESTAETGPAGNTAAPETTETAGITLLVDGQVWTGPILPEEKTEDLMVYLSQNGMLLLGLPFSEAHQVRIIQPGIGENTVKMTGEAVYMEDADCEGQDCVWMGEVTRENLELRVMGGFIICLPHRLAVEVR